MALRREHDHSPLAVGWIPYWNLSPMKQEFQRIAGNSIGLHQGHPTVVNRMLSEGVVSIAPCSSICLLKNPNHEMALPLGVASNGPVQSVYLGLTREMAFIADAINERIRTLREITGQGVLRYGDSLRRVARYIWDSADELPAKNFDFAVKMRLTSQSASSVALARIFYRLVFGSGAYETHVANTLPGTNTGLGVMELLIGDEALVRRAEFAKVIDLGQFWQTLTGMPFVYAVWQRTTKCMTGSLTAKLTEACELAQARMHVEPSVYFPKNPPLTQAGNEIDLASYWKNIHYRLGPKDINGLLLFLCLSRLMVKADVDDAMVVRMLRWQQMGEHSKIALG